MYYVYVLTNYKQTALYVGVTNNLIRRINEHKTEKIEGFTKKYHLTILVFYEGFTYIRDAISAEKRIKGWTRRKKIELISKLNPNWNDLYEMILDKPE